MGIAGLLGSGRTGLALSLFGLNPPDSGKIIFDGAQVNIFSPCMAKKAGIALLPEGRGTEGMFSGRSIRENISSTMIDGMLKHGMLGLERERDLASGSVARLKIRAPSIEATIASPLRRQSARNCHR